MMKYGSIYKITNKLNGKQYIGQTVNSIEKRFNEHCKEKRNRHISNAINSYGISNFEIIELYVAFDKEELNNKEIFFVNYFNTLYPNGYNHRAGGNQNGICSEELKTKISKSKTGKPNLKRRGELRTEKQRLDISRSLGGQNIVAKNLDTGQVKTYKTINETKLDGHNPSNVVQICKKTGRRYHSKRWVFYYESDYANQSGSDETKESLHAQRLGLEPV